MEEPLRSVTSPHVTLRGMPLFRVAGDCTNERAERNGLGVSVARGMWSLPSRRFLRARRSD